MQSCKISHGFLILSITGTIALVYVTFVSLGELKLNVWQKTDIIAVPELNGSVKKILFWHRGYGNEVFYYGSNNTFEDCSGIARMCWAAHDQSLVSIDDFDAILIHSNNIETVRDLPSTRRNFQSYVYVNRESPAYHPIPLRKMDEDFFNVTMTYRLDSDVVWPYSTIRDIRTGNMVAPNYDPSWNTKTRTSYFATDLRNAETSRSGIGSKTKTAIWFVSNCGAKSKRDNYIKELGRHVDVDVFGRCGRKAGCSGTRDCFENLVAPNYYFYLSFENSMCEDYVTEKLYNALSYNVVPVVYGGANYSRFAPPNSYINALDFDSPEELAKYLKALMGKPEEYERFFEWKWYYEVVDYTRQVPCDLCRYLHDSKAAKSYSPLRTWYQDDKCPLQEKLLHLPYLTKRDLIG